MKSKSQSHLFACFAPAALALAFSLFTSGCASTDGDHAPATADAGAKPAGPTRHFKTTDGRNITIGKASPSDGGLRYENPHMEKGKCWIADGFNFNGYDTLYLAPTESTAKYPDKPADTMVHNLAKERLVTELAVLLNQRGIFPNVVTKEADVKPGAKVLKLSNTITEFSKGGGGARYFVGLYGGGQPVLRVEGKATDGGKTVFSYEARRSGVSAGARLNGAFAKDEEIQSEDIHSLVLDLTDFMAAVAGKYGPRN